MLYSKLIARISEISRNPIAQGFHGCYEQNSCTFVTELDLPFVQRGWLKVGTSSSTHQVLSVLGSELQVAEPFRTTEQDVEWVLYDQGVPEEQIRKVLRCFPIAVMECGEGEQLRTHLGVIKMVRRKRKRVRDPQGRWTYSPERLQARLRPGKALQKEVSELSGETQDGALGPEG